MSALTIAHLLSSFGLGGQERVALDLARGQARRGHRVLAIGLAPGPLLEEFRAVGAAAQLVEKAPRLDPTVVLRLAWALRREGVDVLHTHNPQPLAYGAVAARLARAALVHTKHGANPDRGRRLWLRRAGGHLADAYVAVSDATARVARENAECPEARLRTIPNGIDLTAFGPDPSARRAARAELGVPAEATVVGTVGRVSPEKDHALLVRAMGPLLGPGVRLVIVGDGAELPNVRALAARSPFVVLTGARRDVPRLLAAMDLFALSSRTEGLPLGLVEAMATALPIVATAVGGVPEVLGGAGRLVDRGDERALRDAIAALLEDGVAARELGERARVRARAFDAEAMVDAYLALYREVARPRAR
ncbi:MAG: glycosyltransferase [Deltaproteobacteria bacterium]|nr:glycosyltransferase [Deltaproteobacteria bacterium]